MNSRILVQSFCDQFQKDPDEAMLLDPRHPFFQNLLRGAPLQYMSGEAHFFNSRFYVNQDVLIPRGETEMLVEKALELIQKNRFKRVADIGTGSGCVALSLLTEAKAPLRVFASDISQKALDVCSLNAFRHKNKIPRGGSLTLLQGDRAEPLPSELDLIATNPPYIDEDADKEGVHFQTDLWEPKKALYLKGETYQDWFEELFKTSYHKLKIGGAFLMEGHENKLSLLAPLAGSFFSSIEIIKDYAGAERFLLGYKDK